MRSVKVTVGLLTALGILAVILAPAKAALDGTDHDLRERLGIDEFCLPCHAPHNGPGADEGPLWNHQLTEASFERHGEPIVLSGSSKLCMSCHDGVTAVGNFGSITTSTDFITGAAALGTDLTDTHPIGVEYPSDSHILNPTEDVARFLEDNKIECGSCHYAHGGQDGKFLRETMTGSALCRICHTF